MKKALSFAVALGLVAGMATVAVAEDKLSTSVEMRWRGRYVNNVDGTDLAADRTQKMDQRYRVNAKFTANDDVTVNTRLVLWNNDFGNNNSSAHTVDRAWADIKTLGGKWSFGRMPASWGNKFFGWGSSVDRVKATYKAGDLTFAGYLQKNVEGNGANGDQDYDTWGALVIGKAGDTKWGVIANYVIDDRDAAKASGEDTGYLVDAFFTAKAGGANILGELFYSDGDKLDNADKDAILGGFVGATMAAGPATARALLAYWDGNQGTGAGRDCDEDFAPTLLVGECRETAVFDFGANTVSPNDSTYLVTVGANMKLNDKVALDGALAYHLVSEEGGVANDQDVTMVEVDLSMTYALAQNATYSLAIAYGDWDKQGTDDALFVVGNRVDVKF